MWLAAIPQAKANSKGGIHEKGSHLSARTSAPASSLFTRREGGPICLCLGSARIRPEHRDSTGSEDQSQLSPSRLGDRAPDPIYLRKPEPMLAGRRFLPGECALFYELPDRRERPQRCRPDDAT